MSNALTNTNTLTNTSANIFDSATRQQRVDFLYLCFKAGKKKVTKAQIKLLSDEQMIEMISSSDDIIKQFAEFVEEDNKLRLEKKKRLEEIKKQPKPTEITHPITGQNVKFATTSNEAMELLKEHLDLLRENPTGFFEVMHFGSFLSHLPNGIFSRDELHEIMKMMEDHPSPSMVTLFQFVLEQLNRKH